MIKKLAIVLLCTLMISCAELSKIASQLEGLNSTTAISNTENIAGLKNSLDIGIENAVKLLGNENAFLNDALIKIMLPPEAQPIVDNLRLIPGGDALVQKAITSLNQNLHVPKIFFKVETGAMDEIKSKDSLLDGSAFSKS